jgi:eukaryotic-like serine/threonine-protein kinase
MVSADGAAAIEPRVIGRYALYGEIASGGMATVHFGRLVGPVGFSRTVAIKRLHPQFAKDPEFVSMFLDEARLAARVQHPNVVATLDVVPLEGEVFLVMEYVQGESLSRLIRAARRRGEVMPTRVAISVMAGALHGLHAAHEAKSERSEPLNIVHRDISPQNILVGTDGVSRVLDFGVAKAAMRAQSTREGQMKGKISYMAPEQLRGRVDRRTDIFAAGVVLWEALTGTRLFDGVDAGEVLTKLLEGEIPPPSSVIASLPPQVDAIAMRALERDPGRRFQTAREFAIALEQIGMIALNREVGEWVEDVGGDALARRAEQVAEIESLSTTGLHIGSQTTLQGQTREQETISAVSSVSGVSAVSHPSLVSQISRVSSPPPLEGRPLEQTYATVARWASGPVSEGSSPSQVSSLSVASGPGFAIPEPPRRHPLFAALMGVAVALGIALVVLVVVLVHRHAQAQAAVTPPVAAPPTATAPKAVELKSELPAPSATESSEAIEPAPSASASAPAATTATKAETKPKKEPVRSFHHVASVKKPHTAKPAQTAPGAAAKPNCNPPYWLDSNGIQHAKPECM